MVYLNILLAVFLGDLMIKKYAEANLQEGVRKPILGGRIILRKIHNDGIALGKLSEHKEEVRKGTSVMLIGMLGYFITHLFRQDRNLEKTGLAVFLGGALCNWFDRFHQKTVTDYFSFNVKQKKLRNLVFNLSDLCIAGGMILAFIGRMRKS
ncbi:MAG: signal peptidase II [Lachnospiraceae bacterium]|nr:signal peptidase II [Lachnospiraceae bacterium]